MIVLTQKQYFKVRATMLWWKQISEKGSTVVVTEEKDCSSLIIEHVNKL